MCLHHDEDEPQVDTFAALHGALVLVLILLVAKRCLEEDEKDRGHREVESLSFPNFTTRYPHISMSTSTFVWWQAICWWATWEKAGLLPRSARV